MLVNSSSGNEIWIKNGSNEGRLEIVEGETDLANYKISAYHWGSLFQHLSNTDGEYQSADYNGLNCQVKLIQRKSNNLESCWTVTLVVAAVASLVMSILATPKSYDL